MMLLRHALRERCLFILPRFLPFFVLQAATPFEEWKYGLSLGSAFLATGCAFWGLNYSVGQLSTNKCHGDRQGWVWGLAAGLGDVGACQAGEGAL